MNHRKKILSAMLIFLCYIISSVSVIWVQYNKEQYRLSNYNISMKAKAFRTSGFSRDIIGDIENGAIYSRLGKSSSGYEVFSYYKMGKAEIPHLSTGRFFKEQELKNGEKKAVAGKDVFEGEDMEIRRDKNYFEYNGEKYEVIGIISYPFETVMNGAVFLNMKSAGWSSYFFVDGLSSRTIKDNLEKIERRITVTEDTRDTSTAGNIIDMKMQKESAAKVIFLCLAGFVLISVYFYYRAVKEEWYVKKILGFSYMQNFLDTIIYILIPCSAGILVNISGGLLVRKSMEMKYSFLLSTDSFYLSSIGITLVILLCYVCITRRYYVRHEILR